jgi:hypothetical protein
MKVVRKSLGVLWAIASITVMACEDGTTFTAATGTLLVTTVTTGDVLDPDGYELLLDDSTSYAIAVNETVTLTLDVDDYTVALSGLDDPCVVEGDNPLDTSVGADESTEVSFTVVCASS